MFSSFRGCPTRFGAMAERIFLGIAAIVLTGVAAIAGEAPEEPVPLTVLATDESAVFSSGFNHQGIGHGDAFHSALDFTRRIPLKEHWFFQLGVSADRFDFGGADRGPLPSTLQTFNVPIGISYITQGHVGFLVQLRPGFYFEHEISRGAFDVPLEIGGYSPLINEKLYAAWGLRAGLLQHYGVFPVAGFIWVIKPTLILHAMLPEPRLEYNVSDRLAIWAGGEFLGGNYKMDSGSEDRFSGTVVEYYEIRVGAGATITPAKGWSVKLAAGCATERKFNFYRASQSYVADPAPYVRLQASVEF